VFAVVQKAGFGGVSLQVEKRGGGKDEAAQNAQNGQNAPEEAN
jgi:hypothetical protein